jgi:hypothetical protein
MKFFIRDLALVTVIVALALGWWQDRRQREDTFLQMREEINLYRKADQDAQAAKAKEELKKLPPIIRAIGSVPDPQSPVANPFKK